MLGMVYYNVGSSTFVCEIKMVMTQEEKLAIEERALRSEERRVGKECRL